MTRDEKPRRTSFLQLDIMASLRTGTSKSECTSCIINNFRPPVPRGDRSVRLFTGEAVAANGAGASQDQVESGLVKEGEGDIFREILEFVYVQYKSPIAWF